MNKIKYVLTTAHLKLLYQSLVEPYLNYCCIRLWASPVKSIIHLNRYINFRNVQSELYHLQNIVIILHLFFID